MRRTSASTWQASTRLVSRSGGSTTTRSSPTWKSSSMSAAGTSATGSGRRRATRTCSKRTCGSFPPRPLASAWHGSMPPLPSRSTRCRTLEHSTARRWGSRRERSPASRLTTRRPWAGTYTRRWLTGCASTSRRWRQQGERPIAAGGVRGPRAVRAHLVPADRAGTVGATFGEHDGRDARVLRRVFPTCGSGNRVPGRRRVGCHARRRHPVAGDAVLARARLVRGRGVAAIPSDRHWLGANRPHQRTAPVTARVEGNANVGHELDGKVAIVTGGANGLGRATVGAFVEEGGRAVIADVDDAAGDDVVAGRGDAATFKHTDVSDATSVGAVVDHAVERYGALHVMVNNAGISSSFRRFMLDDLRDFNLVMAVDLFGVLVGTQQAARHMREGGSIINTTSI